MLLENMNDMNFCLLIDKMFDYEGPLEEYVLFEIGRRLSLKED